VVFFSYLFFLRLGEDLNYYFYGIFLGGSVLVFFACFIHIFFFSSGQVNRFFILGFSILAISAALDILVHRDSNLPNIMFFLIFAWSIYRDPVRRFRLILNLTFILAILWSIIAYYLGMNIWGFWPGQATTNLSQGLWWRIGLFPFQTPPFSSAFSLVVFLVNFRIQNFSAKLISFLAFYFFLFSGSRTLLIAFLACILIFIVAKHYTVGGTFMIFSLSALISLLMVLSNAPILLYPFLSWSDFLSSLVLRVGDGSQNDIIQNSRSIILFHFMENIGSSWPFGMGLSNLSENYSGPGGSEMPGVRIVAESGIFGLLSLIALASFSFMKGVGAKFFVVIFFMLIFFYGSFLHPYSPVFLAMLLLLSNGNGNGNPAY
jgi:hypothetical protein